jgi:ribose/xylose/arabinose/galactoside ABC-type transport system permease subunit
MATPQSPQPQAGCQVASAYNPSSLSNFMERFGMLLVLLVLFGLAGLVSADFLTPGNLLNVSRQVALNGVISVGMTMVILTRGIDLSVGAIVALSAVLLAKYNNLGAVALLLALGAGVGVGLLNGFFVTKCRMQPFVVTLGMMIAIRGVALILAQSHPIEHVPAVARFIGHGEIGPIPAAAVLLAVIAVLAWIFLSKSRTGRYVYAVGGNEDSTRLAGINVTAVKMLVYVLSGVLAAVAGIIIGGHLNVGDPAYGSGFELDAIAAVAIGGTSLAGGRGGVGSTIVGLLIVGMVSNLLNLLNVAGYTQFIISGAMIVVAVAIQRLRAD